MTSSTKQSLNNADAPTFVCDQRRLKPSTRNLKMKRLTLPLSLTILVFSGFVMFSSQPDTDWKEYNGDGSRSHYSTLSQINLDNVSRLKVAWTYASGGADTINNRTQIQSNPIVIDGVLYAVSAGTQAFALQAATGKEIWRSRVSDNKGTTSRGVAYWSDGKAKRIFSGQEAGSMRLTQGPESLYKALETTEGLI